MIQPNELRIGNYVNVTGYGYSNGQETRMRLPKRVEGLRIYENGDAFAYFGDDRISCLNIRPIQVTKENILNCGFEEVVFYENVYHKDDFRIHLNEEDLTGLLKKNDLEIEVTSVHQLQNLYFALAGKELEWKS